MIKPRGEAFQGLTRQPGDEIGMDVNAGLPAQKTKILLEPRIILPAFDEAANMLIERLNANFELEHARREPGDDFAESFRQTVRDHFEMEEVAGLPAGKEEFENGAADVDVQVERAVDELEMFHASLQKAVQMREEIRERRLADRNIERRKAELA